MSATSANAIIQLPGSMVTVDIGNGMKYNLHRTLLVSNSDYFERALNGKWREGDECVVCIQDVKTDVFNIFVDWLRLKCIKLRGSLAVDVALIDAIVLGDYLLAPTFTEAVKAYVLDKYRSVRYFSVMDYAYQRLPENHPVYRWIRHVHVTYHLETPWSMERRVERGLPVIPPWLTGDNEDNDR